MPNRGILRRWASRCTAKAWWRGVSEGIVGCVTQSADIAGPAETWLFFRPLRGLGLRIEPLTPDLCLGLASIARLAGLVLGSDIHCRICDVLHQGRVNRRGGQR